MTSMVKLAGGMLSVYAAVVLAAWLGQRMLIYHPSTARVSPATAGLAEIVERELLTPDGARLVVWQHPAPAGALTLIYLHGNAGSLVDRAKRLERYRAARLGFAALSYRGYGGSTGRPSEAANVADATLLYDTLVKEGVKPTEIVVYGESLGTGVAIQLATARPVRAVVLDAPYTSVVEIGEKAYPFLPVRLLLSDRYESRRQVAEIKAPLLVLHGARDGVIPLAMGRALHAAAKEPKHIAVFPGGRHSDLDDHGAVEEMVRWLAALPPRP